jgi:DNA-binding CsgD family transcriptional regulator
MDPHALAFTHAPLGLVLLENRVIRAANLRFAEIFAGPVEGFDGMDMARLYPSVEDYQRIGARGLAAMRESGTYDDERIMQRLSGELFWCRGRGRSLTPEDPFARGVWSFSDLSEARPVVQLTPRERDVAMLTGQGLTSKEIGRKLDLSYRTVEQHRARLLKKFDARNIAELVARFSGMPF